LGLVGMLAVWLANWQSSWMAYLLDRLPQICSAGWLVGSLGLLDYVSPALV